MTGDISQKPQTSWRKQAFWFMVCPEPICVFICHGSYEYGEMPRRVSIETWVTAMALTQNSGSQAHRPQTCFGVVAWGLFPICYLLNLSFPADSIREKWMQLQYFSLSFTAIYTAQCEETPLDGEPRGLHSTTKSASDPLCGFIFLSPGVLLYKLKGLAFFSFCLWCLLRQNFSNSVTWCISGSQLLLKDEYHELKLQYSKRSTHTLEHVTLNKLKSSKRKERAGIWLLFCKTLQPRVDDWPLWSVPPELLGISSGRVSRGVWRACLLIALPLSRVCALMRVCPLRRKGSNQTHGREPWQGALH